MFPNVSNYRNARANLNKTDDKLLQHQSTYPRDQDSDLLKSDFYQQYLNVHIVQMRILGLLGIYFDAAVHSICHQVFTVVYYSNWFWTHCCSSLTLFVIQIAINSSLAIIKYTKQAQKGFRPPNAMKGIGYFQNLRNFLEIFWIFGGAFLGAFFGIFQEDLLEEFFGRISVGGITWQQLTRN